MPLQVVGLDASAELLAAARNQGIKAVQLDAHDLAAAAPQLGQFDAVISNAALHWMKDLKRVIIGMHSVLVPGGRLICEMGGHGNVASIFEPLSTALAPKGLSTNAINPWVFPTAEEVCPTL